MRRATETEPALTDARRLNEEFDEFERFVDSIAADCGLQRQQEPQPEPARGPEPAPAFDRRHRRGRYRGRTEKLGSPDAEPEEPIRCFSPERRFDAKERRERPPRRYDKSQRAT